LQTPEDQFCRDFSFTDRTPELHSVLQRVQEVVFIDACELRLRTVACLDHVQLLQSNKGHNLSRIPVAYCKVDEDLKEPNELEELRNLNIKEILGIREIQDTKPSHTSSTYTHNLKLWWKVNILSEEHPKIDSIGILG